MKRPTKKDESRARKRLRLRGADPSYHSRDALWLCAAVVEDLVEATSDMDSRRGTRRAVLALAVIRGDLELVKAIANAEGMEL